MASCTVEPQLTKINLQKTITCPHCWHDYAPEHTLWVAEHADLRGDIRLGPDQQKRFLPTRFDVHGNAIDARGFSCKRLACPRCHLDVPRAALSMKSLFFSVLGAPGCGKSFFLASMIWRLRRTLPEKFALTMSDADTVANATVNEYEQLLFFNARAEELVRIRKTELQGDLYDTVSFGEQVVNYPRPFSFAIQTTSSHPNHGPAHRSGRTLCLYDNAGEHFLPGQDTVDKPVTQHLARSRVSLFLFDPTQDLRFRRACRKVSDDPQVSDEAPARRQETVLYEALERMRSHRGLNDENKALRRLVVVVTKFDTWAPLLIAQKRASKAWVGVADRPTRVLDVNYIDKLSEKLRQLLQRMAPEIVTAAEAFSDHVRYIPVSATGVSTETDPESGLACVRPRDVDPVWAEVPLLYALCCSTQGVIPHNCRNEQLS